MASAPTTTGGCVGNLKVGLRRKSFLPTASRGGRLRRSGAQNSGRTARRRAAANSCRYPSGPYEGRLTRFDQPDTLRSMSLRSSPGRSAWCLYRPSPLPPRSPAALATPLHFIRSIAAHLLRIAQLRRLRQHRFERLHVGAYGCCGLVCTLRIQLCNLKSVGCAHEPAKQGTHSRRCPPACRCCRRGQGNGKKSALLAPLSDETPSRSARRATYRQSAHSAVDHHWEGDAFIDVSPPSSDSTNKERKDGHQTRQVHSLHTYK